MRGGSLAGLAAGVAVAALVVYFFTGGFVLYVNMLAIAWASAPLAEAVLRGLLAAAALFYSLRAVAPLASFAARRLGAGNMARLGFLLGLLFAAIPLVYVSTPASIVAALAAYLAYVGVVAGRGGLRGRLRPLLVLAAVAAALMLISLYAPVAASHAVDVKELGLPIDVNGLKRFIPLMTAYVYASDRIQSPTHRIYPGDSYVYYNGTHSVYNWIIEPEGLWNQLYRRPLGVVFVYGDQYPPVVRIVRRPLAWGLHVYRIRGLYIDTLRREIVAAAGPMYKPVMEDNAEVLYRGRVYIIVPLLGWKRGLLYSLPVLAGYAVVDEQGHVEVLTPQQASRDPRLRGLPLLPEVAARRWAEIYRYHVGLLGVYMFHNTYVIRDVGTNPQPYLEQGPGESLYWVLVAEPAGHTFSVRYIIYVPANTTSPRLLIYRLVVPAIGISKVESYVKQAHPNFDWGELTIQEPMPAVINGRLYWKVTVTTKDYRGLVSVDLVDAVTGQVYSLVPRHRVSYLDLLSVLLHGKPVQPLPQKPRSIEERITVLEEKINKTIEALKEIQRELEAIKRAIASNRTIARR